MSGSQNKKNVKCKTRRDRILNQVLPAVACIIVVAVLLYVERDVIWPQNANKKQSKNFLGDRLKMNASPGKNSSEKSSELSAGNADGQRAGEPANNTNMDDTLSSGEPRDEEGRENAGLMNKVVERVRSFFENQLKYLEKPADKPIGDTVGDREFIETDSAQPAKRTVRNVKADSLVLSDIKCKLADRDDLIILLTIELFFDSNVLGQELSLKSKILETVAKQAVSRLEFGDAKSQVLSPHLLSAFNNVLGDGQLWRVEIKKIIIE
ncbi:MAG: hypothetical protein LBI42_02325 [Chitinispirillales bacterium]|jgi:hypothetical protein|nr:hypothetical protein [Chitinispirillales bacterium]